MIKPKVQAMLLNLPFILSLLILIHYVLRYFVPAYSYITPSVDFDLPVLVVMCVTIFSHVVPSIYSTTLEIKSEGTTLNQALFSTFAVYALVIYLFGDIYWRLSLLRSDSFTEPLDQFNAMYFSITTITTVGYGDIVPKGHIARGLAALEMLIGLTLNLTVFAVTAGYVAERISSRKDEKKQSNPPSSGTP